MKIFSPRGLSTASLTLAAALLVTPAAFANLIVNGVNNGTWTNAGGTVFGYNETPTDPTVVSLADLALSGASSLTQTGGSLTLTSTQFGIFFGQNGTAGGTAVNLSGGNLTVNANVPAQSRFALGNNRATTVTISGGLMTVNTSAASSTDLGKGFYIGRDVGGASAINFTGGKIITSASRFAMGGQFTDLAGTFLNKGTTNIVTFGAGGGAFEFTGLSALDATGFARNSNSYFNWLSGSEGTLSVNAIDFTAGSAFFSSLASSGGIRIGGVTTAFEDFTYSYSDGRATISAVPEPSTIALLIGGGILMLTFRRRRIA